MLACLIEYWIQSYILGRFKNFFLFVIIGLVGVIMGHYFRISAQITAKTNFTHQISFSKKKNHKLITSGVYKFSRHPSYFGWYLWSVSTQIMLMNPICVFGFTVASYYFFKDRIQFEEQLLLSFFEQQYIDYMKKTPIRIPCKYNAKSPEFLHTCSYKRAIGLFERAYEIMIE